MDLDQLMAKAKRTNMERSKVDRANGFIPPEECGPIPFLATIASALEAGIIMEDWDSIAEALDLLQSMIRKLSN